ncbi:GIY-YIG nuclease family protein [Aquimarina sp. 2304DJ70-9]|uniref:GIY-YIG nuclease family protein n=1 Tax=Aquimarina penaris TaxID=3231044 RepID=UPI003461BE80
MLKPKHQYALYIITNKKNGTLYIGISNNLERRIFEHKNKLIEGFTKKYDLDRLVYFEIHKYVNDAITREKRLKAWKRQWKINLIEEDNPNWNDLAFDWYN